MFVFGGSAGPTFLGLSLAPGSIPHQGHFAFSPSTGSECLGMREVGGKMGCYSIGDVLGWSFSWLTFPLALGLVSGSLARLRVAQPTAPRASPISMQGARGPAFLKRPGAPPLSIRG